MSGIDILRPDNHKLYLRVQHLVSLQWKWEAIADDVGLVGPRAVMDLCEWVIAYREPKKLPMVNSQVLNVPVPSPELRARGVRLAVWERQRAGARKALREAGL